MEPQQPDIADLSFSKICLEFVLGRLIHDLANSISGIESLSRYHLRGNIADSELKESLELIQQSANSGRDLLVAVGNLLHPTEIREELVRVSEIVTETGKLLVALMPKSIQFQAQIGTVDTDAISVSRSAFQRAILTLLAVNLGSRRVSAGMIELQSSTQEDQIAIEYRSTIQPLTQPSAEITRLLRSVGPDVAVSAEADEALTQWKMLFPRVDL